MLSAAAAFLHAFYNGIENVFKRVAVEFEGGAPGGEAWHRELLDSMKTENKHRPPVISEGLCERLSEYLQFRHFFRHAYTFDLRWDKMSPLVLACKDTLAKLEEELDKFMSTLGK